MDSRRNVRPGNWTSVHPSIQYSTIPALNVHARKGRAPVVVDPTVKGPNLSSYLSKTDNASLTAELASASVSAAPRRADNGAP